MSHFRGRNIAGSRRARVVFRIRREPLPFGIRPEPAMMGSGHNQGDMTPTSSEISERRRLAAIGIKAGKSQRLIARELGVTATTISRYLEVLGITANKKPTATRRKPAVVFKGSSPATSDRKVASQNPTKRIKLRPRPVFPRPGVPEPLKPGPPKPLSPAFP